MKLEDILKPERTILGASGASKKKVLEYISETAVIDSPSLSDRDVFEILVARERLGSTGIGNGVAIPHGRLSNSDQIIALLVLLDEPIDFDAIDRQPVDLFFTLLVPEEDTEQYLKTLATLAQVFQSAEALDAIRSAEDSSQLYETMITYYSKIASASD